MWGLPRVIWKCSSFYFCLDYWSDSVIPSVASPITTIDTRYLVVKTSWQHNTSRQFKTIAGNLDTNYWFYFSTFKFQICLLWLFTTKMHNIVRNLYSELTESFWLVSFKPYSTLMVTSYCTQILHQQKGWDRSKRKWVHGVTCNVTCTGLLLSFLYEDVWLWMLLYFM